MMITRGSMETRLERVEEAAGLGVPDTSHNDRILTRLVRVIYRDEAGLALVERGDCPTEAAWLKVQAARAWLGGDGALAHQINDRLLPPRDPSISAQEALRRLMSPGRRVTDEVGEAITKARQRTSQALPK